METTLHQPLEPVIPIYPVKRWTADQYLEMIHAGILTEDDKVELIDGVITEMAPSGDEHTWGTIHLNDLFDEAKSTHYRLIQGTARITEVDMFDPDFALVRRRGPEQRQRHPQAEDIDLVIEVAKSSIKSDQTKKAAAYAKAGIIEYWIADVNNRAMLVYKQPTQNGYQTVESFDVDAQLTPIAFPSLTIRVGEVFGESS